MQNVLICYFLLIILLEVLIVYQEYLDSIEKPKKPLDFNFTYLKKEKEGINMALVYSVTCSRPVDVDVIERRLVTKVNGEVVSSNVYDAGTVDFGEVLFSDGDSVILSLVDVDDAGNVSEPATLEFVAADTIPPQVPGGLGVTLLREVTPNE
jgi:hypothetical protein